MLKKIRELFKTEKGQSVVEYVLLLGFITIVALSLLDGSNLQSSITKAVNNAKEIIQSARLSD